MLIPSERHTAADLVAWREYERADKAHANGRMLGRNWRRCREIAEDFLRSGPAHVAVSWGKDSVLAAHLVLSICPKTPLRWIRVEPILQPECLRTRDAFLRLHPAADYREIEIHCERDEAGFHATGTLERGIAELNAELGPRVILGIRADESSVRRLRVFSYGPNTKLKSAPLAYLTAGDVFALLCSLRLPVNPVYAMLGAGRWNRHHLRTSSLGGKRGDGLGRSEWEREYFGDELRRLETPLK